MSDHWKVASILILYKMVIVALYTFEVCDCVLSQHQMIKILYLYSQFLKIAWGESGDTLLSWPSSMLNSLLWSESSDGIINACDPMQNPGQTWIFINWVRPTWPRWLDPVSTLVYICIQTGFSCSVYFTYTIADVPCTVSSCSQGCANISGSQVCYCVPGYRLDMSNVTCSGLKP